MTLLFIILFVAFLGGRVAAGFFADKIPFLAALITPLTWLCVGSGIIMGIFIAISIYKEIRRKVD